MAEEQRRTQAAIDREVLAEKLRQGLERLGVDAALRPKRWRSTARMKFSQLDLSDPLDDDPYVEDPSDPCSYNGGGW